MFFFLKKSPKGFINNFYVGRMPNLKIPLRKKCPYLELFWSYFPAFGLNTEIYGVSLRIQSKCGKMRTRITPNTETYYTVKFYLINTVLQQTLDKFIHFLFYCARKGQNHATAKSSLTFFLPKVVNI